MPETTYIDFLLPAIIIPDNNQNKAIYVVQAQDDKKIKLHIVGGAQGHQEVIHYLGLEGIFLGGGVIVLNQLEKVVKANSISGTLGAFPVRLLEQYFQCFGYTFEACYKDEKRKMQKSTIKWLEDRGINIDNLYV